MPKLNSSSHLTNAKNDYNDYEKEEASVSSKKKYKPFLNKKVSESSGEKNIHDSAKTEQNHSNGFKKTTPMSYPINTNDMTRFMWSNLADSIKEDIDNGVSDTIIMEKINTSFLKNKKTSIAFDADNFSAEILYDLLIDAKKESISHEDIVEELKLYTTISHKAICDVKKMITNGIVDHLLDELPSTASGNDYLEIVNKNLLETGSNYRLKESFVKGINSKDAFKDVLSIEFNNASIDNIDELIEFMDVNGSQTPIYKMHQQEEQASNNNSRSFQEKQRIHSNKKDSPLNNKGTLASSSQGKNNSENTGYVITEEKDSVTYWHAVKAYLSQDIKTNEATVNIVKKLNALFDELKNTSVTFTADTFDPRYFLDIIEEKLSDYKFQSPQKDIRTRSNISIAEEVFSSAKLANLASCKIRFQINKVISSIREKIINMEANDIVDTVNKALEHDGCSYRLSLKIVFDYAEKPRSALNIIDNIELDLKDWYQPIFSNAFVTKETFKDQLDNHKKRERINRERENARRQEQARNEKRRKERAEQEKKRQQYNHQNYSYQSNRSSYTNYGRNHYRESNSYSYARRNMNNNNFYRNKAKQSTYKQSSNIEMNDFLDKFYGLTLDKMLTKEACQILGISTNNLNKVTIKKAYRKLSLKFHPDKFTPVLKNISNREEDKKKQVEQATEIFKLINNAYRRLSEIIL